MRKKQLRAALLPCEARAQEAAPLPPASEAGRCLAKLGLPAKQAGRLLRHRRVARELLPRLGCEARGPCWDGWVAGRLFLESKAREEA